MENKSVAILLATYNGEKYLREQIASLMVQTYHEWHLYVHDDGSSDGTLAILQETANEHPSRVTILDYRAQGGSCRNFMSLLQRVEASYYMFCDQDDVWHPEKIELTLGTMLDAERNCPPHPVVVHTDLRVVNQSLEVVHSSFFEYSDIHPDDFSTYDDYAYQNIVTGCTMMLNAPAKASALSRPFTYATMHDTWIVLRAIADGGKRRVVKEQLIDYRQHGDNALGAVDGHRFNLSYRLRHISDSIVQNYRHYRMMNSAGKMSLHHFIMLRLRRYSISR